MSMKSTSRSISVVAIALPGYRSFGRAGLGTGLSKHRTSLASVRSESSGRTTVKCGSSNVASSGGAGTAKAPEVGQLYVAVAAQAFAGAARLYHAHPDGSLDRDPEHAEEPLRACRRSLHALWAEHATADDDDGLVRWLFVAERQQALHGATVAEAGAGAALPL